MKDLPPACAGTAPNSVNSAPSPLDTFCPCSTISVRCISCRLLRALRLAKALPFLQDRFIHSCRSSYWLLQSALCLNWSKLDHLQFSIQIWKSSEAGVFVFFVARRCRGSHAHFNASVVCICQRGNRCIARNIAGGILMRSVGPKRTRRHQGGVILSGRNDEQTRDATAAENREQSFTRTPQYHSPAPRSAAANVA